MRIGILLTFWIFFQAYLPAQDFQVKRERTFTGKALYGFMNGGSDLYFEYDFQELKAIDVIYKGEEYSIEIYQMKTPIDAFGIYSIHAFKCLESDQSECFDCLSKYQLQAAIGDKCIFIVFTSAKKSVREGAKVLLNRYADCESSEKIAIPEQLKFMEPPYSGNLKYAKGGLGAFAINLDLSALIEGIEKIEIWHVAKPGEDGYTLFLFSNNQDFEKLKSRVKSDQIIQQGSDFLLIKASN